MNKLVQGVYHCLSEKSDIASSAYRHVKKVGERSVESGWPVCGETEPFMRPVTETGGEGLRLAKAPSTLPPPG